MLSEVPRGLAVRISGFHPGGPGSIPGVGTYIFFYSGLILLSFLLSVLGRSKTGGDSSGNGNRRWNRQQHGLSSPIHSLHFNGIHHFNLPGMITNSFVDRSFLNEIRGTLDTMTSLVSESYIESYA